LTLAERFSALFARIQDNVLRHEHEQSLPYDEVRWLAEAGFGALRLPEAEGGGGVSVAEFFALLTDLAAADSNQPQIWRNHIAFVEDRLQPQPVGRNQYWRKQVASGAVIGGAWSERGTRSHLDMATELSHPDGSSVLNGVKYYSTGGVIALVDARAPGVAVADDWSGFGQRTTGSGTSMFATVAVEDAGIFAFSERAPYQESVYQLVHVATLAGIARAAHRDAISHLRKRARAYGHGLSDIPRDDAQLQAVVGRVGALAASAGASVARAARYLDAAASAAIEDREEAAVTAAVHEAAVAVYEAQITATDEALAAATVLFDALGSSALDISLALDRHWRNARTITSHNPRVYKERLVGAWHLNGTPPVVYGGEKPAADGASTSES
jgi:alkylation response protein AidB-like acyl-CoA dehydrogenase